MASEVEFGRQSEVRVSTSVIGQHRDLTIWTGNFDRGLQGRRCSTRLERNVGAAAARNLFDRISGILGRDSSIHAVALRKFPTRSNPIHHDYPSRVAASESSTHHAD